MDLHVPQTCATGLLKHLCHPKLQALFASPLGFQFKDHVTALFKKNVSQFLDLRFDSPSEDAIASHNFLSLLLSLCLSLSLSLSFKVSLYQYIYNLIWCGEKTFDQPE